MIEMKYDQLSNQGFLNAVQYVAGQRLPVKAAYNIKKLADAIMKARKEIGEQYMTDIIEKYAKKDDKGEKVFEDGEIQMDIDEPEKKDAFLKAQELFGSNIKKIERNKLVLGVDIPESISLSAAELTALDLVLTDAQSEQGPVPVIPFRGPNPGPQPA